MPQIKATLRHLRMSPRKVRLVADLVRGLPVKAAEAQLFIISKRSSVPILKLLRSAIANATHNSQLDPNKLYIKEIMVDKGVTIKRWWPRARGSVAKIEKRNSHVTIILDVSDKVKQPNFVFVKKEKNKDKKTSKNKGKKSPKNPKEETGVEITKTPKVVEEKKKFFRRKSV